MITLKTLPQASAQDVYNQVVRHLLTQNCKSEKGTRGKDYSCLYRGPNNTKCAAGCLISDEEMTNIKECSWGTLIQEGMVPTEHCNMIYTLQSIHDQKDVADWPILLRELGEQRGLSTAVLDEFAAN